MAPSTSRKLSERGDLVLRALAPVGVTRAAFVTWFAANNSTLAVGTVVDCDGLSYRYTGSGSAIGDLPGWVPNGLWYARHWGAKEDYDQATQSGTDDYAAIQAALDYAGTEWAPGCTGGVIWIERRSLSSATLIPPRGVRLDAVVPRASVGQGQTATSTFPITYNEGSGIVGSHISGPVVLLRYNDTSVGSLTLGATTARRSATITTGEFARNCGVLICPPDTASANIQRVTLDATLIRDQPAEGYMVCGNVANFEDNGTHVHNCGSHGFIVDDGTLAGRTNKSRPGIYLIRDWRGNNLGGHLWAIGHPDAGAEIPYRGIIDNCEGFRSGNVPALLYASAGVYVSGEQVTLNNCAPSGTTGYSGNTPGLDYSIYIVGRNVRLQNCRYINYLTNPIYVGAITGYSPRDIEVAGGYAATDSADPVNLIKVGALIRGLYAKGVSGDFSGEPIDKTEASGFGASAWGFFYGPTGIYDEWGVTRTSGDLTSPTAAIKNIQSYPYYTIADDGVQTIAISGTVVSGIAMISGSVSARGSATVHFRVGTTPFVTVQASSGVTVGAGTTALTGITGVDGQLNIACTTGGLFYIENRTGAPGNYTITFLSVNFADGEFI